MRSTPPRRARRPPPSNGGGIPLVPLLLGVIVLGFIIGAGLSIARRNANVAYTTPTPVQSLPNQAVTPAPTEKPTPEPTEGPTEAPTVEATDSPAAGATSTATHDVALASPSAMPKSSVGPTASPVSSPKAKANAVAAATHAPKAPVVTTIPTTTPELAATPLATHAPHAVATKAPQGATAVPVANAPADASSDFTRLAAAVVRQYLAAVSRGDQESAYAALGGSPGDRGVALTEAGIVDARTKIGKVEAHGGANSATVNVDLQTPDGTYYGQYTVHRNETGAAVIVQHSIAK